MAQKDKIKELVGRSLNSYHTKSLQQIDRIEKKNKEQNHKISILSNELDNDYLTKTEEGSVVSLEYSKEGMVYLDELQGNTLVNYCTDGSKELTLNGDIDVEGVSVTTTEGVDNGKVDVMCEGNTLVNLGGKVNKQSNRYGLLLSSTMILKPSTLYTFIVTNLGNQSVQFYRNESVFNATTDRSKVVPANSTIVFTWETLSNLTDNGLIKSEMDNATQFTLDVVLLEGDWTNREIPSEYFEGMKSVGQDDTNGHKIEILSQNKNVLNLNDVTKNAWGITVSYSQNVVNINGTLIGTTNGLCDYYFVGNWDVDTDNLNLKPNTKYTFSGNVPQGVELYIIHNKKVMCQLNNNYQYNSFTNSSHGKINAIMVRVREGYTFSNTKINLQLEEGSIATSYTPHSLNKKEILINEPLRSLPSGKKDRFVKIGNKWYIERNCREVKGTDRWYKSNVQDGTGGSRFKLSLNDCEKIRHIRVVCNLFSQQQKVSYRAEGTYISTDEIDQYDVLCIRLADDIEESEFKSKYSDLSVVYSLETPIYEPLEIEPTLNTYNDITHISNNSIIPCNIKIKNSGYNAIIKPSTLYTVALDTNKSGTIGMNLGGVKGTTTNNVLTLTTPATLSDDSLRLYGKDIKGSKVRLLEGDKTNWIPSFFEGMKSSFEDKFDTTDNTYKMEILSNNKNLFDIDAKQYYAGWGEHDYQKYKNGFSFYSKNGWNSIGYAFESLKNKTVTVCATVTCVNKDTSKQQEQPFSIIPVEYGYPTSVRFRDGETKKVKFNITLKDNGRVYFIGASNNEGSHRGGIQWLLEDILVVEGIENDYVPREYNKIQFSSIKPLRKLDKFVFKDNMLMVERNNAEKVLNGTENWSYDTSSSTQEVGRFGLHNEGMKGNRSLVICDKYAFKTNYTMTSHNYEGTFTSIGGNTLYLDTMLNKLETKDLNGFKKWLSKNPVKVVYELVEPVYEEIPFELQKIILEGYENGTLFFDTNIPPTSTVTYAGETPIVKSVRLNKTEVLNNTNDINDNIIPYLMDMDYRVVCLQLATEEIEGGVSVARLFGGAYEMLKRDILSKRLSRQEYGYRLADYYNAGKLTEQEVRELEELR